MKRTYSAPKLTSFGNVTEITQVNGTSTRTDFSFLNGLPVSDGDDLGSFDICGGSPNATGNTPAGDPVNCDPRF